MYHACGPGIVCRYPRELTRLVGAGLCLSFSQPPELKLVSPGAVLGTLTSNLLTY